MTGGEWLSIHEPILPADGLTCFRLKQIDSPAERKRERESERERERERERECVFSTTCFPHMRVHYARA